MDWLTFFSKIIEALAWPSVAFGVILIFRGKLSDLVPRLTEFKYKDLAILFDAVSKQKDRVAEEKEEVKSQLEAPGLQPAQRIEAAEKFETIVRQESNLAEQSRALGLQLHSALTPGRQRILTRLIVNTFGLSQVLAMSENDLIRAFHEEKINTSSNPSSTPAELNAGTLVALRSSGIIDDSNELTIAGATLMKLMAFDIAGKNA